MQRAEGARRARGGRATRGRAQGVPRTCVAGQCAKLAALAIAARHAAVVDHASLKLDETFQALYRKEPKEIQHKQRECDQKDIAVIKLHVCRQCV